MTLKEHYTEFRDEMRGLELKLGAKIFMGVITVIILTGCVFWGMAINLSIKNNADVRRSGKATFNDHPDQFAYRSHVKIVEGFYRGHIGIIEKGWLGDHKWYYVYIYDKDADLKTAKNYSSLEHERIKHQHMRLLRQ